MPITPRMQGIGLVLFVAGGTAVCAASAGHASLTATVPGSPVQGTALLTDGPDGLRVAIHVNGAAAGNHGIHIHEKGDCGDGGNAAGGHFNPAGAPHGFLPLSGPQSAHAGDMGNIVIDANGEGASEVTLPGITLEQVKGRAIILHEKADDFGQPTGNAGGRIGCGVIEGA